jgi:quinol monooxygenase YgiN
LTDRRQPAQMLADIVPAFLAARRQIMLIAIVDFTVAPENRAAALAVLLAEAPAVRSMAGNLAFQPYLDPVNAEAVRIFHEWQDQASFETYTGSDTFKRSGQVLRPMMTAAPVSRRMSADLLETVR